MILNVVCTEQNKILTMVRSMNPIELNLSNPNKIQWIKRKLIVLKNCIFIKFERTQILINNELMIYDNDEKISNMISKNFEKDIRKLVTT